MDTVGTRLCTPACHAAGCGDRLSTDMALLETSDAKQLGPEQWLRTERLWAVPAQLAAPPDTADALALALPASWLPKISLSLVAQY